MQDSTHSSLLQGMRDGTPEAWERIVDIWTPILHDYCRNRGFSTTSSEDITQNVMLRVYRGIHRFQRDGKGKRFRFWMMTIVRNEIAEYCSRNTGCGIAMGGSSHQAQLAELTAFDGDEFDEDWCTPAVILTRVLDLIRSDFEPHVWRAFELFKCKRLSARETAIQLKMTENAVRQASHRVCRRIKEEMDEWFSAE
jgi:RNA polymerase sigma-70 factor (ECF subfamily)